MNNKSLSVHIETLAGKHEALNKEISARLQDEVYDDSQMGVLKRRKLLLKDEITLCKERLKSQL